MGGAAKTLKPIAAIANPIGYGINSFIGNQAHNTINNPMDPIGNFKKSAGSLYGDFRSAGELSGLVQPRQNQASTYGPLDIYMDPAGDSEAIRSLGNTQYLQSTDALAGNVNDINSLGQSQYDRTQKQIVDNQAARTAARAEMAKYLQDQAALTFKNTLPGLAEDYNSGGLLNSTGYQQEVARQQGNLASSVTNQLGLQGAQDMYSDIGARDNALNSLYGFQNQALNTRVNGSSANLAARQQADQQALGRIFNLQDYAREANVAKQIGAQLAPSTKPTKGSGTAMGISGLGAGAQAGSLMGGPAGAMAGGIGGGLLGLLGGGGGK